MSIDIDEEGATVTDGHGNRIVLSCMFCPQRGWGMQLGGAWLYGREVLQLIGVLLDNAAVFEQEQPGVLLDDATGVKPRELPELDSASAAFAPVLRKVAEQEAASRADFDVALAKQRRSGVVLPF